MVTDQQVRRLQRLDLRGLPKERAADKAGMDPKKARKYRHLGKLPSEVRRMDRDYRTRPDPFVEVGPQFEAQLRLNPGPGGQLEKSQVGLILFPFGGEHEVAELFGAAQAQP